MSNKFDYTTNTDSDLKFYGPMKTITYAEGQYSGDNSGLSLHAVWVESEGALQDASKVAELCGTTTASGTLVQAPTDGTANLSSVSSGGEYYKLNNKINAGSTITSIGLRGYPTNLIYSGTFSGASAYSRGSNGYYLSSAAHNSQFSYDLHLYNSYVYPGTYIHDRYFGSSVRCIAD